MTLPLLVWIEPRLAERLNLGMAMVRLNNCAIEAFLYAWRFRN